MRDENFSGLLARGVEAVLETMFFAAPLSPANTDPDGTLLLARVVFEGERSGTLDLRISETSSRGLAAAFLGEDEESLTAVQIGQVVCELANMFCGWLLSQIEHDRHFELSVPQLLCAEHEMSGLQPTSEASFAIEKGILTVALYLDIPHEC